MKITKLDKHENKIIPEVISVLNDTTINSKAARKLARKIIKFTKTWYPDCNISDYQSDLDLMSKSFPDILCTQLISICAVLIDLIKNSEDNSEFVLEAENLLWQARQYAHDSLHWITVRVLRIIASIPSKNPNNDEYDASIYLKNTGTLPIPELDMLAKVEGITAKLTPLPPSIWTEIYGDNTK